MPPSARAIGGVELRFFFFCFSARPKKNRDGKKKKISGGWYALLPRPVRPTPRDISKFWNLKDTLGGGQSPDRRCIDRLEDVFRPNAPPIALRHKLTSQSLKSRKGGTAEVPVLFLHARMFNTYWKGYRPMAHGETEASHVWN